MHHALLSLRGVAARRNKDKHHVGILASPSIYTMGWQISFFD